MKTVSLSNLTTNTRLPNAWLRGKLKQGIPTGSRLQEDKSGCSRWYIPYNEHIKNFLIYLYNQEQDKKRQDKEALLNKQDASPSL